MKEDNKKYIILLIQKIVPTPDATIIDILGLKEEINTLDGVSLQPVLNQTISKRPKPIGFIHQKQLALIGNQYKLISQDQGKSFMLFDITIDPAEETDLATALPDTLDRMIEELHVWLEGIENPVQK